MRKILISFVAFLMTMSAFAGGLVTNSNQSALFTRLQNRNASTSVDAVYFNPAGLTNLGEGFFASINNQTIKQTQTITNDFVYLNGSPREFIGEVSAPLFPSVYAALNVGNFSFSLGFTPIGGGGGAKFENGLSSIETMVAQLLPALNSNNILTTNYDADIFFEGSSVYYGYQFNTAYRLNHILSFAAGIRLVNAKNTYDGYMKDISINPNYPAFGAAFNGQMVEAADFFSAGEQTLDALSSGASQLYTGLQPIVSGGGGGVLLSQGTVVGLSQPVITQIQQLMGAAGQSTAQIGSATIAYAQQVLGMAAPVFSSKADDMAENATRTEDIFVDADQKGTGITPILSMNINAAEDLNISLRYEFKTKLRLLTNVVGDANGGGMFVDGREIIADIPAQLAVGFDYNPVGSLKIAGSFNTFFDNKVDWDGSNDTTILMIDRNFMEYGLGIEYGFGPNFRASVGWSSTSTGVNSNYQTDRKFSTSTNSFGAGFGYRINKNIDLNIGGQYTFYDTDSKTIQLDPEGILKYNESYTKRTWLVGIGVDFTFGVK